jgi:putative PIN family toxin of toxin-antitoxin system
MIHPRPCLVLDTNTILRGIIHPHSPSGLVLDACLRKRFSTLLSRPVRAEYAKVLAYPEIVALNPALTPERIREVLKRFSYVADLPPAPARPFSYPRDPTDTKFLELAIAGQASHLISHDKDLLSLPQSHSLPARTLRRRCPHLHILTAADFLRSLATPP